MHKQSYFSQPSASGGLFIIKYELNLSTTVIGLSRILWHSDLGSQSWSTMRPSQGFICKLETCSTLRMLPLISHINTVLYVQQEYLQLISLWRYDTLIHISLNFWIQHQHGGLRKSASSRCSSVLTDPFSMTLLSIITALEPCSQIISQKWPQVFLKGPCRSKVKTC